MACSREGLLHRGRKCTLTLLQMITSSGAGIPSPYSSHVCIEDTYSEYEYETEFGSEDDLEYMSSHGDAYDHLEYSSTDEDQWLVV